MIGVFPDCVYQQETVQLRSGDLLFAFTDGVTEAQDLGNFVEATRQIHIPRASKDYATTLLRQGYGGQPSPSLRLAKAGAQGGTRTPMRLGTGF